MGNYELPIMSQKLENVFIMAVSIVEYPPRFGLMFDLSHLTYLL